VHQL